MHTPLFWKDKGALSAALLPLAAVYGFFAKQRQRGVVPFRASVPVICVGNVAVGGSGKTPVALALGAALKARGARAHYLTRGYKGRLEGPVQVNSSVHTAREVGDEPLLLAEMLPTWVAKDRARGAKAAAAAGAEVIIMDDGFQNPTVDKDISLLVVDGAYGFGNGRLLPAGPLRESVPAAAARADAVILMGEDRHHALATINIPVFHARIEAPVLPDGIQNVPLLAFAGIARPRKFYRTLQTLGLDVRKTVAYPDHHFFSEKDLAYLRKAGRDLGAKLVTTAKDHVRLPLAMREETACLKVEAVFAETEALLALIAPVLRIFHRD